MRARAGHAEPSRHMLPYGKKDRQIYTAASQMRAKENCGLVPFDFPSLGLRALFEEMFWVDALCRDGALLDLRAVKARWVVAGSIA